MLFRNALAYCKLAGIVSDEENKFLNVRTRSGRSLGERSVTELILQVGKNRGSLAERESSVQLTSLC
jgi:hypothetical protein